MRRALLGAITFHLTAGFAALHRPGGRKHNMNKKLLNFVTHNCFNQSQYSPVGCESACWHFLLFDESIEQDIFDIPP
jgi:hypothetical protein